jgi:NAD(P)-dependent dehydrogenase (short-subunit alcohol dehydrogenase family)
VRLWPVSDAPLRDDALRDRVVLVAGACGALGSAVARAAAAAGATVVLLGRRVAPMERLYDELASSGAPTPAIYPLDLAGASPDDYAALAQAIASQCGRLDAVVHAAAHFAGLAPLGLTGAEDWVRALHVNLSAPFLLSQACLPLLAESGNGTLVFVLEDETRVTRPYWGGYGVAKCGLDALVGMFADELENQPVRVVALQPAPMRGGVRARAYMAEDPGMVETPARAARVCVAAIAAESTRRSGRIDLRAPAAI